MKKLEALKFEKTLIESLKFIPPQAKKMLIMHYQKEIDEIEKYGAENNDV